MVLRAVLIWCALLVVASINGAAREAVLIPRIGEVGGRAVSTLALSTFIVVLTWISIGWIAPRSAQQAWAVGVMWVALTLAFEFLAGHYLFHNPWSRLLEDYNVIRGRIWILVLITTLVSPRVCAGLRHPSLDNRSNLRSGDDDGAAPPAAAASIRVRSGRIEVHRVARLERMLLSVHVNGEDAVDHVYELDPGVVVRP